MLMLILAVLNGGLGIDLYWKVLGDSKPPLFPHKPQLFILLGGIDGSSSPSSLA